VQPLSVPARHLPVFNVCIAIAFRMSVFSVILIVFSMFFYAFCEASVLYCFAPLFSAILTNLILFIFHIPNTTVLLF